MGVGAKHPPPARLVKLTACGRMLRPYGLADRNVRADHNGRMGPHPHMGPNLARWVQWSRISNRCPPAVSTPYAKHRACCFGSATIGNTWCAARLTWNALEPISKPI